MDAHNLFVRNRLQSQRIGGAQVGFLREGQLLEIRLGLHVGQIDVLELLGVERGAVLERAELVFQQGELFVGELHGFLFPLLHAAVDLVEQADR